jgi:hypothetical protein
MASTDDTFDLPINAGQGDFSKDQTTFGVTLKGYFEIVSPAEGSWTLTIKDDNDLIKQIDAAVPGQQYRFEYKTGFKLKLRVQAVWSEKRDTALKLHLKASY